nr:hypothetical protein [Fodinicola feengrottensis]
MRPACGWPPGVDPLGQHPPAGAPNLRGLRAGGGADRETVRPGQLQKAVQQLFQPAQLGRGRAQREPVFPYRARIGGGRIQSQAQRGHRIAQLVGGVRDQVALLLRGLRECLAKPVESGPELADFRRSAAAGHPHIPGPGRQCLGRGLQLAQRLQQPPGQSQCQQGKRQRDRGEACADHAPRNRQIRRGQAHIRVQHDGAADCRRATYWEREDHGSPRPGQEQGRSRDLLAAQGIRGRGGDGRTGERAGSGGRQLVSAAVHEHQAVAVNGRVARHFGGHPPDATGRMIQRQRHEPGQVVLSLGRERGRTCRRDHQRKRDRESGADHQGEN